MLGLTAKQRQIFDYIKHYIEIHHFSPSLMEIKQHFSYSSLSTVHEHLQALQKKNAIEFEKNSKRSISIHHSESQNFQTSSLLPIIGLFSSGLPLELFPKQQDFFSLPFILPNLKNLYGLKVYGNGLAEEHLLNQDLLIIEATSSLQSGEIGLVSLKSGPSFLKKILVESDRIQLEPLHPISTGYTENFRKDELIIRGKLLYTIRSN